MAIRMVHIARERQHPHGIDPERFLATLTDLAVGHPDG